MATGLMALVDDCIKDRWQTRKTHLLPLPSKTFEYASPRAIMQHVFGRRPSKAKDRQSHPPSPSRYGNLISTI